MTSIPTSNEEGRSSDNVSIDNLTDIGRMRIAIRRRMGTVDVLRIEPVDDLFRQKEGPALRVEHLTFQR